MKRSATRSGMLIVYLIGFRFLMISAVAAESPSVAAGPQWVDTGIDLPLRHAAGPHVATTGEGATPWQARYNWQAGQWTTAEIPNVTSITRVQQVDRERYVLIAEGQRVMVSHWATLDWTERYVLENPSETFLINRQDWDIIVDDGILVSTNGGLTWQKYPTPDWRARAIASGSGGSHDGRVLVVGDDGEVFVSHDRIDWSRLEIGTDEDLVAAAPLIQTFVVITATGRIFTTDTRTAEWTDHGKRLPPGITSISGDSPLFAVAEDGRLFTSANGILWSERILPTGEGAASAGDGARYLPLVVTATGRLFQADHMLPFPTAYSGQDGVGEVGMSVIYASIPFEWLLDDDPTGVASTGYTATQSGGYRVLMSRPSGDILTDAVDVFVKETFDDWREREFSAEELADPEISGAGADPTGTGWPNLLRFAVHKDGHAAGPVRSFATTGSDGETRLGMTYVRPKAAGGIQYREELSLDLENWAALDSTVTRWVEDLGDSERVTVSSPESEQTSDRSFLRLTVGLVEP